MSRLTEERFSELYAGTLQLVAEHGYDKLTMDQIAEATKSSKATLYRQWGSKASLVVEALQCANGPEPELPDTGTLRGDLKAMALHKGGEDEADSELITAIIHAMKQNDELAEAVRTQLIEPGRGRVKTLVQRAIDRGEVAADCPALPFTDLLFMAPFVLSAVLEGKQINPKYMNDYFEGVVLPALGVR